MPYTEQGPQVEMVGRRGNDKGKLSITESGKDMIIANAQTNANSIRDMLHTPQGLLIRVAGNHLIY